MDADTRTLVTLPVVTEGPPTTAATPAPILALPAAFAEVMSPARSLPPPVPSVAAKPEPPVRRPTANGSGMGGVSLPPPTWNDVQLEDLKDTGRLLKLFEQAVALGLVSSSEADRLRFVAAAEHARAIGTRNPAGLFVRLVRGGIWTYLTQDDEDAASLRLKHHDFGDPWRSVPVSGRGGSSLRAALSEDARVVREIRASLRNAGYRGDPFYALRAHDSSWTRTRWDEALAELGEVVNKR